MRKKNDKKEVKEVSQKDMENILGKENMEKRLDNLDIASPCCLADKESFRFKDLAHFEDYAGAPYTTIPLVYIGTEPISDSKEETRMYAMNSPYNSIMKDMEKMKLADEVYINVLQLSKEKNLPQFNEDNMLERYCSRGKYLMSVYKSRCASLATSIALNFVTNATNCGAKSFEYIDSNFIEEIQVIIFDGLFDLLPKKNKGSIGEKSYLYKFIEGDQPDINYTDEIASKNKDVYDVEYSFIKTEEIKNQVTLAVYNYTECLIISKLAEIRNRAYNSKKISERYPDDKRLQAEVNENCLFDMDMEFCSEMNKLFFAFNTLRLNVEFAVYTLRSEVGYYINSLDYSYNMTGDVIDNISSVFIKSENNKED